ncbi:hypothetical protein [Anaerocolumna jejuensis]|uniref:hypothetical protein n=1 Tax=Anaerocolumna jejuensis TaxID=259063 RepID=UPI003F7B5DC2
MDYEGLLAEAHGLDLIVKEAHLIGNKGRIKGNRIAIRQDIPTLKEKSCILAEELGHYYTSCGDILDQSKTGSRKQEHKARLWSYNRQIGLMGIIKAYEARCTNIFEMAEYLDVTEEFLIETLDCYRSKYGQYIEIDSYIVYFEPHLGVFKMIQ